MSGARQEPGVDTASNLKRHVEAELSRLRGYEGLTTERVGKVAPNLQDLAAADAAKRRQPVTPSLPATTVAFIISGLNYLAEQNRTSLLKLGALKAVYGIAVPQRATADERRREYGARLVEEGGEGRANDTLQGWENAVIPGLADLLLAWAGKGSSFEAAPKPTQSRTEHSAFTDGTHIFTATGTVQEVYVVRHVQALISGLDTVQVSYNYYSDPRPGIIQIIPYTDCRLLGTKHTPAGELRADLELPSPLEAGEMHRLSYKVAVSTDKPCRNILRRTPRTDGGDTIIRAQFHLKYVPKHAWTFEEATEREIPWEPAAERMLPISKFGYTEVRFDRMKRGLTYGIVWEWE